MQPAQSLAKVFSWTPDDAFVISERGLFHSRVQFGDGYSQVSYKGIARSWRIVFRMGNDQELRAIADLISAEKPVLWTQPPPHDLEGQHLTVSNFLCSSETNGRLTRLEYEFHVELIGPPFAEEAGKKYGPRDTGWIRHESRNPGPTL